MSDGSAIFWVVKVFYVLPSGPGALMPIEATRFLHSGSRESAIEYGQRVCRLHSEPDLPYFFTLRRSRRGEVLM